MANIVDPLRPPTPTRTTGTRKPEPVYTTDDKQQERVWQLYLWATRLLTSEGFPKPLVPYIAAQVMFESAGAASPLSKAHNYSGIKFVKQAGAYKLRAAPANAGGGYWAGYKSPADWAKDFKRIISLNRSGQGRPIEAGTAALYLGRLKANGYFQEPLQQYKTGVDQWYGKFLKAEKWYKEWHQKNGMPAYQPAGDWGPADDVAADRQRDLVDKAEGDTIQNNMKKHWKWWLGGTVAAVFLVRALK